YVMSSSSRCHPWLTGHGRPKNAPKRVSGAPEAWSRETLNDLAAKSGTSNNSTYVLKLGVSSRPSQRPANVAYYRRNREFEITRVRVRQAGTVEMLRDLRRAPGPDGG